MVPAPRRMLLGVVAVVLGVAAHAGAGGAVVPAPSTLTAALLVGALAAAGAGTGPLSPARSVIVLGTGQLLLHVALTGGSSHAAAMPDMDMAPTAPGSADTLMLGAHALVVVVVAALVSGADRSLTRALEALRRSVAEAVAAVVDLGRALPAPMPAPVRLLPAPHAVLLHLHLVPGVEPSSSPVHQPCRCKALPLQSPCRLTPAPAKRPCRHSAEPC